MRVDLKKDQKELRAAIKKCIDGIPGTSSMIGYPLAHRISSALSGSNSEIAINIYGTELPQLRLAARKAKGNSGEHAGSGGCTRQPGNYGGYHSRANTIRKPWLPTA